MQCAYHPQTETLLRCNKCDKPICGRCVVHTPVGARCRDCAQVRALPTYAINPVDLLKSMGAALGAGLALGLTLGFLDGVVPLALRWIFHLGGLAAAGHLIGETVSVVTNRKRAPFLQWVAVGGVLVCYVAFGIIASDLVLAQFYTLIGLIVGIALALGRVR